MAVYASTFVSGLQEPVKDILKKQISDVDIIHLYDGLVVYRTRANADIIKKLEFFNNSFLVLEQIKGKNIASVKSMLKAEVNADDIRKKISPVLKGRKYGYRIVVSKENRLIPVRDSLLKPIESKLSGIKFLYLTRRNPDVEFWFLLRSEKTGFFMMRLTQKASTEKRLSKGELRPELCSIMCSIAGVDGNDIFLDPFCGHGAIPITRASMFKYNMIFASDSDPDMVKRLRKRVKQLRNLGSGLFIVKNMDALNMSAFDDGFIDKIVTDPPWGMYKDMDMDIEIFYKQMMKEMYRVLKPNGIMVILTARKDEFERVLSGFERRLMMLNKYDILVSGKKASIYKILKEA